MSERVQDNVLARMKAELTRRLTPAIAPNLHIHTEGYVTTAETEEALLAEPLLEVPDIRPKKPVRLPSAREVQEAVEWYPERDALSSELDPPNRGAEDGREPTREEKEVEEEEAEGEQ